MTRDKLGKKPLFYLYFFNYFFKKNTYSVKCFKKLYKFIFEYFFPSFDRNYLYSPKAGSQAVAGVVSKVFFRNQHTLNCFATLKESTIEKQHILVTSLHKRCALRHEIRTFTTHFLHRSWDSDTKTCPNLFKPWLFPRYVDKEIYRFFFLSSCSIIILKKILLSKSKMAWRCKNVLNNFALSKTFYLKMLIQ